MGAGKEAVDPVLGNSSSAVAWTGTQQMTFRRRIDECGCMWSQFLDRDIACFTKKLFLHRFLC